MFAVIGLLINVLLAWMFALFAAPNEYHEKSVGWLGYPESFPPTWETIVPSDWPDRCHYSVFGITRGLTWLRGSASEQRGNATVDYAMTEVRVGWPYRSMRWRHGQVSDPNAERQETIGGVWIPIPDWLEQMVSSSTKSFHARRRLPVEPMWMGLLVNTALFGGGLWILLRLRCRLRRWLRHHRKQCVECGYPIGLNDRCTECGSVLHVNVAMNSDVADHA